LTLIGYDNSKPALARRSGKRKPSLGKGWKT
jgi:hypothetical protein